MWFLLSIQMHNFSTHKQHWATWFGKIHSCLSTSRELCSRQPFFVSGSNRINFHSRICMEKVPAILWKCMISRQLNWSGKSENNDGNKCRGVRFIITLILSPESRLFITRPAFEFHPLGESSRSRMTISGAFLPRDNARIRSLHYFRVQITSGFSLGREIARASQFSTRFCRQLFRSAWASKINLIFHFRAHSEHDMKFFKQMSLLLISKIVRYIQLWIFNIWVISCSAAVTFS